MPTANEKTDYLWRFPLESTRLWSDLWDGKRSLRWAGFVKYSDVDVRRVGTFRILERDAVATLVVLLSCFTLK